MGPRELSLPQPGPPPLPQAARAFLPAPGKTALRWFLRRVHGLQEPWHCVVGDRPSGVSAFPHGSRCPCQVLQSNWPGHLPWGACRSVGLGVWGGRQEDRKDHAAGMPGRRFDGSHTFYTSRAGCSELVFSEWGRGGAGSARSASPLPQGGTSSTATMSSGSCKLGRRSSLSHMI